MNRNPAILLAIFLLSFLQSWGGALQLNDGSDAWYYQCQQEQQIESFGKLRRTQKPAPAKTDFEAEPASEKTEIVEKGASESVVHMNGRIYDPLLGRFLSADPVVQFPNDLQSYNRYSYTLNNPLRYTDPGGHSVAGMFWSGGDTNHNRQVTRALLGDKAAKEVDSFQQIRADAQVAAAPTLAGLNPVSDVIVSVYDAIQEPSIANIGFAVLAATPIPVSVIKKAANVSEEIPSVAKNTARAVDTLEDSKVVTKLDDVVPAKYEVGTCTDLKKGDVVGDKLGNHHAPQKADAKSIVSGYPQDKLAGDAPAIRLPDEEHAKITKLQSQRDTTGMSPRKLLAEDIKMLKQNTEAPHSSLQELIRMNKEKYNYRK